MPSALHAICFVKDAHGPVRADGLVECRPCGPVFTFTVAGIAFKAFEIAPVLNEYECAHTLAHRFGAQKPALRIGRQLGDHGAHCSGDGKPFPDFVEMVDPHPDDEHDQRPLVAGCETSFLN